MNFDTRISLKKLEIFDLVVEVGGVGRAAERLFVAQPVVSAHLRTIEDRIGVKLFYREGRQSHLTEAGREVHTWATDVLRRTRELSRHLEGLGDGERGSAVIGASLSLGSYVLPSLVARICMERPQVGIDVHIADSGGLVGRIADGHFDFAIIVRDSSPTEPGLSGEVIGEDELLVVAAPDWRPDIETVSIEELGDVPFVDSPKGLIRRVFVDEALHKVGLADRRIVASLDHPEAVKRATQAGLGVAILFRSAVSAELQAGTLREVPIEDVHLGGELYLVHRNDKVFSAFQTYVIDAVKEHLRAPLPAEPA